MRFLVLTDLHLNFNFENVPSGPYDYVICLGDLFNIEHTETDDFVSIDDVFKNILDRFQIAKEALLFVPGNHDPEECFIKGKDFEHATNVHNKRFDMGQVKVFGFGGSINSYYIESQKLVWNGYPEVVEHPNLQGEVDMLLLHQGPSMFSTSIIDKKPENRSLRIDGGSKDMRELILKFKPKLVIHGHTHFAMGMGKLGESLIVNPGAFRDGYYAVIDYKDGPNCVQFNKL